MPQWTPSTAWSWWHPSSPRYPDSACLEGGDLLLFAYRNETAAPIRRGQEMLGFRPEHAAFTHAAVYLGSDCLLCEAVDPHVRLHIIDGRALPPSEDAVEDDLLLIRRVPNRSGEQRSRIAAIAMSYLDEKYGWSDVRRAKDAIRRRSPSLPESAGEGLLCSMLFNRAWSLAMPGSRLPVHRDASGEPIVLPAALAETDLLRTVEWRSLTVPEKSV